MTQKFDFASLKLFVAVCECRSITRAADLENITASAVSKRISRLEEFAGGPLLVRAHSGVTPTNEGVRLLEHARSVLYNLELLERDVVGSAVDRRGTLTVLANRSANAALVSDAVATFLADSKYRNVDILIGEMTSHEVVSRIRDGLGTIGVCWAETDMAGVEWKPSKRDHLSAVVRDDHPLAKRHHIAFADTLAHAQVGIHSGGPVTHQLRRASVQAGTVLRYRVIAPSFDAMIRFVESGAVMAIMPETVASRYARLGRIIKIPLTDPWSERQFAVCCKNFRALSRPGVELFHHLLGREHPKRESPSSRITLTPRDRE